MNEIVNERTNDQMKQNKAKPKTRKEAAHAHEGTRIIDSKFCEAM